MYFVHENEVYSNFQVTMVQDCAYFTTINESKSSLSFAHWKRYRYFSN